MAEKGRLDYYCLEGKRGRLDWLFFLNFQDTKCFIRFSFIILHPNQQAIKSLFRNIPRASAKYYFDAAIRSAVFVLAFQCNQCVYKLKHEVKG